MATIDRAALVLADLTWVTTEGSAADRTKAAIEAYLHAVEVADTTGRYPSVNEMRAYLTTPPPAAHAAHDEEDR